MLKGLRERHTTHIDMWSRDVDKDTENGIVEKATERDFAEYVTLIIKPFPLLISCGSLFRKTIYPK